MTWDQQTIVRRIRELREVERERRSGRKLARQRKVRRRFWTRFRRRTDLVFFIVKLIAVLVLLVQGWERIDWAELAGAL